jgi:phosphopantothenoylcysteine decarboxylase/phosphopantothenate--cysteine ligase
VFHAAAVADFRPGAVFRRGSGGGLEPIIAGKIPTVSGSVLVELEPTPKVLSFLRGWFGGALIVGWKYEVEGTRLDVIALARKQIETNATNACVANGPAYGAGFGVVTPDGEVRQVQDRQALFEALAGLTQRQAAG